jgi:hypothetical protein
VRYGKGTFILSCLLVAAAGFATESRGWEADSSLSGADHGPVFRIPGPKVERSDGQPDDNAVPASPYIKGSPRFVTLRGPRAAPITTSTDNSDGATLAASAERTRMTSWEGSFQVLGAKFPFAMIGTDPAKGSATTKVPVSVIPVQISFPNGTHLSPLQIACGDTQSPLRRVLHSPLFNDFAYHLGGTFVGNTQYMDAFQRANFWSDVSRESPDYHVLLSVTVAPLQTATPDVGALATQGPCAPIAAVDINFLDRQIQNLITALRIPAHTLPIFLLYNTFETQGGGCCIIGYHSVTGQTVGRNNHPYLVAAYTDPGIFTKPIDDIHGLSHELGEWLDDPFTTNFIPAWGNVGQVVGCSFFLEAGDAVTGIAFEIRMNGFTYHPEDLVFLSWFARETPSRSVNGWYTFLNRFPAAQPVCQP